MIYRRAVRGSFDVILFDPCKLKRKCHAKHVETWHIQGRMALFEWPEYPSTQFTVPDAADDEDLYS